MDGLAPFIPDDECPECGAPVRTRPAAADGEWLCVRAGDHAMFLHFPIRQDDGAC